ncbi:MAG: hypothetical protein HYU67_01390 [Flavobacteriia bacterium]|nr:hypothetical protein [Flavobacteriia bacterium]
MLSHLSYIDLSDQPYPVKGERQKKFKEIIYPSSFLKMRNLQSDSTLFATFTPPGYYNKKDPRKTELGRIYFLKNIELFEIKSNSNQQVLNEIQFTFLHKSTDEITKFVIGGLDFNLIPVLSESEANDAWKNSMGIGNHSFYETYSEHLKNKSLISPFYALLLDGQDKWLDSHKVGIDGPLIHFSDQDKKALHIWFLSFERHAIVGHYRMQIE